MSFIPRNQVISVPLYWLKDFYHQYQKTHIFPSHDILPTPTTFQEDLTVVINYFNGRLTDKGLEEYAEVTPYPEGVDPYDRIEFLYQLYQEIEQLVVRTLRLPQRFYTSAVYIPSDIRLAFEAGFLFIYDGRKDVYIPDELYRTFIESHSGTT